MSNEYNTIVPLEDMWKGHILPLLLHDGDIDTRARLRMLSHAQRKLDAAFVIPLNVRVEATLYPEEWRFMCDGYRGLAALNWPAHVSDMRNQHLAIDPLCSGSCTTRNGKVTAWSVSMILCHGDVWQVSVCMSWIGFVVRLSSVHVRSAITTLLSLPLQTGKQPKDVIDILRKATRVR